MLKYLYYHQNLSYIALAKNVTQKVNGKNSYQTE